MSDCVVQTVLHNKFNIDSWLAEKTIVTYGKGVTEFALGK